MVPTLAAALIADSRIMDARHHPFDVLSGSLLGIVMAWILYRQYFPPVSEPWHKGRAYPIRSWGKTPLPPSEQHMTSDYSVAPIQATDEEQAKEGYATGNGSSNHGGEGSNVFRNQIRQSQRRRA